MENHHPTDNHRLGIQRPPDLLGVRDGDAGFHLSRRGSNDDAQPAHRGRNLRGWYETKARRRPQSRRELVGNHIRESLIAAERKNCNGFPTLRAEIVLL